MNAQLQSAPASVERFVKIGEDGALLQADAPEWVAVLDTRSNLMWAVEVLKRQTFKKAHVSVSKLDVAGFKDWRLPSVEELFLLADRTRHNPSIDIDFFPETPSEWFWTSTPASWSPSDYAWVVYFNDGYSGWSYQGNEYHVRAVRAGQS